MLDQAAHSDIAAEVDRLRARLDELERLLRQSQVEPEDGPVAVELEPPDLDVTSSRRSLLRNVAIATGGAIAATLATSVGDAAAVAMSTGTLITEPSALTQFNYTGATAGSAFLFQSGSAANASGSVYPSALAGWTTAAGYPTGVYGYTPFVAGYGVIGSNVGGGIGVAGRGETGVSGVAFSAGGTGVAGSSSNGTGVNGTSTNGTGVLGTSTGSSGVEGDSVDGYGIRASSTNFVGLQATGGTVGVHGTISGFASSGVGVFGDGPIGVQGSNYTDGVGVFATSASGSAVIASSGTGAGVHAFGATAVLAESSGYALSAASAGKAAILLSANGWSTDPARITPSHRTDAHVRGELDVDADGVLWWCIASGTPGVWRELAGPSSAGAFHALPPGRVYDSRDPLPGPTGPLTAGQQRTVSVADRRVVGTGAVAVANFVPPGATAIAANVTVVETAGAGFLTVNPGGVTAVNAATVNWFAPGQILNNGVTLTLDATRKLDVIAGGGAGAATNFVIDVSGYYL